jgi:hypothetical protein
MHAVPQSKTNRSLQVEMSFHDKRIAVYESWRTEEKMAIEKMAVSSH